MPRISDPALAERRRRQITEAALLCFRRRGFHQASMQEICAQAQISPGALYRYFPSKTHLITAIAEDVQARLEAVLTRAEAGDDSLGAIEAMGQVMFEEVFSPSDGSLMAEVLAEAARDQHLGLRLAQLNRAMMQRLQQVIATGQKDGRLAKAIAPATMATLIVAMIDGLGMRSAISPDHSHADNAKAFKAFVRRCLQVAETPTETGGARARRKEQTS